jgi:hypothetical protein
MYMVRYKVEGFGDRLFSAGPYPDDDVDYQCMDIAGFDGVHSVLIEPATEADRTKLPN